MATVTSIVMLPKKSIDLRQFLRFPQSGGKSSIKSNRKNLCEDNISAHKKAPRAGGALFIRRCLFGGHGALVAFDHLLDHLAADGTGLLGGQVAVLALLQGDAHSGSGLVLDLGKSLFRFLVSHNAFTLLKSYDGCSRRSAAADPAFALSIVVLLPGFITGSFWLGRGRKI
mgnify:CR=1 FL=1